MGLPWSAYTTNSGFIASEGALFHFHWFSVLTFDSSKNGILCRMVRGASLGAWLPGGPRAHLE
ncbi:hypothetical protein, partial [Myxococcus vastator]|uniref:hypothetical protein n=1 Tax=Myxococcus vastator TaxID=2709664 RepID=UPI001966F4AD